MIEIASKCRITKVSHAFTRIYAYTARVERTTPQRHTGTYARDTVHTGMNACATYFLIAIAALVPAASAQNLGSTVTISTIPDGAYYSVDGQIFTHATSAIWPAGSKHILSADVEQDGVLNKTKLTFGGWSFGNTALPGGNIVTITADPSITSYTATFSVQYALSLIFFSCPDATNCHGPGTVYQGSAPFTSSQDIYEGAGASVILMASPNPGFVFAGWVPGAGQVIQGPIDTVTMNGPVSVYPEFQVARPINLATSPGGLQVLADRAPVLTPVTLEWGWNTTHSVGPVSPQEDRTGNWWVFSSWSDGGGATHAYQVGQVLEPDTVTATYVPGVAVALGTSPANLKLSIDGRDNWPTYGFVWGVGETHQLVAPAQQTDTQGRAWAFSSWSNGGAASQALTIPASAAGMGIRLTATYTPMGQLTVSSSLAGLAVQVDGASCATPCSVVRPVGTTVRVSAPASVPQANGSRQDFLGWPGTLRRLERDADRYADYDQRELSSDEPALGVLGAAQRRVVEHAAGLAGRLLRFADQRGGDGHGVTRV